MRDDNDRCPKREARLKLSAIDVNGAPGRTKAITIILLILFYNFYKSPLILCAHDATSAMDDEAEVRDYNTMDMRF